MRTYSNLGSKLFSFAAISLLSAAGVTGCMVEATGDAGESVGSTSDPVYVLSTAAWPEDDIHVCFMNPEEATWQERLWIRLAAEGTWERVSGLRFNGWDDCATANPSGTQVLRIEFQDRRPYTAKLGVYNNNLSPGMVLNSTFVNDLPGCASSDPFVSNDGRAWSSRKQYCMSVHAVHEFGHAIGYSHERNRPDSPSWANCSPQGGNGDTMLGDWDLYSVMSQSYCISSTGRLSPIDIAATQQVYGLGVDNYFWYVDGNTQEIHGDYSLPASIQVEHINLDMPTGSFEVLTGDFDGDDHGDMFRYGAGSLEDQLYYGTDTRGSFSKKSTSVSGTYQPFVGNFDGLNGDDIFWYRPGPLGDNVWWSNGASRTFQSQNGVHNVSGTYQPVIGDFDGDGRDDIFWFASGTGRDTLWWGNANRTFTKVEKLTGSTAIPLAGDFDGDGRDDILFYKSGTGSDVIWWGNANRSFSGQVIENVIGTYEPTVGDFDGNGTDDVLWNHASSLDDKLWLWRKGQRTFVDTHVVAVYGAPKGRVADFDADGVDDIFWQD